MPCGSVSRINATVYGCCEKRMGVMSSKFIVFFFVFVFGYLFSCKLCSLRKFMVSSDIWCSYVLHGLATVIGKILIYSIFIFKILICSIRLDLLYDWSLRLKFTCLWSDTAEFTPWKYKWFTFYLITQTLLPMLATFVLIYDCKWLWI